MVISFELPQDFEKVLRENFADLSQAAKEAFIIQAYRMGHISLGYVAKLTGLATSIEAQRWLSDRGVPLNYSIDDLRADRETLAKLFPGDRQP